MELLQFVFQDLGHFIGSMILLSMIGTIFVGALGAIRGFVKDDHSES